MCGAECGNSGAVMPLDWPKVCDPLKHHFMVQSVLRTGDERKVFVAVTDVDTTRLLLGLTDYR